MLEMTLLMSFLYFWLRWGIEAIFFLGHIFFGWDGSLRQSFFWGRVAFDIDIHKRVFTREERFSLEIFFYFF